MRWVREARPDGGYALLATLWLLLLAASIAGLLMLRSIEGSRTVAAGRAELVRLTAEESALETSAADLMLNAGASRFRALPSTAVYRIAGRDYTIEASREAARIDINEAPLALIESALRSAGLSAGARARLLAALDRARRSKRSFASLSAVTALDPDVACLGDILTPYQGRTAAVANTQSAGGAEGIGPPSAWRLRIEGKGVQRAIIARPGLPGDRPLQILDALHLPAC